MNSIVVTGYDFRIPSACIVCREDTTLFAVYSDRHVQPFCRAHKPEPGTEWLVTHAAKYETPSDEEYAPDMLDSAASDIMTATERATMAAISVSELTASNPTADQLAIALALVTNLADKTEEMRAMLAAALA